MDKNNIWFREMIIDDYEDASALWQTTSGVGLSTADSRDAINEYLKRNEGISYIALDGEVVVGAMLCGHDGRRGFIHHLTVRYNYRRLGIGRKLVWHCLQKLDSEGIQKCHLFVFKDNQQAITFWEQIDFTQRHELSMMSIFIEAISVVDDSSI